MVPHRYTSESPGNSLTPGLRNQKLWAWGHIRILTSPHGGRATRCGLAAPSTWSDPRWLTWPLVPATACRQALQRLKSLPYISPHTALCFPYPTPSYCLVFPSQPFYWQRWNPNTGETNAPASPSPAQNAHSDC